jgi:hypothetical protein
MNVKTALWIVCFLSVILLSIQVLGTTHITSFEPNGLGLLSRLPLTFWIGLSILGILLFTGRKSRHQTVIVIVLIFFYLFAIPTLVLQNKADLLSISYFRSSQIDSLISHGRLSFDTIPTWDLQNWPGFFFIGAFLSSVSGLHTTWFADYFPLLLLTLLGIVTYSVLRIKLNNIFSSFGALWVLASFFTGQEYFSPQAIAYILFAEIFLLLAKLFFTKTRSSAFSLSILILFVAAVTTHLLTSFIILASVITIYVLRKTFFRKSHFSSFFSVTVSLLLASIFLIYQAFVIKRTFIGITSSLYEQLVGGETHIADVAGISQGRTIGSTAYLLEIVGTYSIVLIAAIVAISAILITLVVLLRHKKAEASESFWIAWIIIAALFGLSVSYGGEGIIRAFMFLLLPTCYFAVKYLSKKPTILIVVLILLISIHFPASYARLNYLYVPESELQGVAIFAKYTPSNASFFYENNAPMPYVLGDNRTFVSIQQQLGVYSTPSSEIISDLMKNAQFVVTSNPQSNLYHYFFGVNPIENISLNSNRNILYDNGEFQIFGKMNT